MIYVYGRSKPLPYGCVRTLLCRAGACSCRFLLYPPLTSLLLHVYYLPLPIHPHSDVNMVTAISF